MNVSHVVRQTRATTSSDALEHEHYWHPAVRNKQLKQGRIAQHSICIVYVGEGISVILDPRMRWYLFRKPRAPT